MFRNYFKTAFRNLWKNRSFTAINLLGLTIGITCCLLIGLYIQHELSYDNFQEKRERTVRVIMEYSFGNKTSMGNYTSTKVAPAFKKNFPEVEAGVRMFQGRNVVKYQDKLFNESNLVYADSNFFQLFSFKLLQGNPQNALQGPNKVIVTVAAARKYFGNENPIGKVMGIGADATAYEVTGVTEDCPSNSQIKYDMLLSFSSLGPAQEVTYWDANYTTYLLLKDKASIASLQSKIPAFMKREMSGNPNIWVRFHLEPFTHVHLYSPYDGFEPNSSITYIYIISIVAFLLLAIACFTYINLGTASSMERAREVGIRKVLGAMKKQVFYQYLGESFLLCFIALLTSILLSIFVLPYFNQLTGKQFIATALFSPLLLVFMFVILCSVTFLAGSYPAIILSAFNPVKVLKGSFKNTGSGLFTRKSLIVFQFVISVFLIICTFIIQQQLHYIQNKKLGYNREHVVVLPIDKKIMDNMDAIKVILKSNPDVLNVSKAVSTPAYIKGGYNMRSAAMPEDVQMNVRATPVDEDFVNTTGLQLIAGSDLSRQDMLDVSQAGQTEKTYHFILNESAAKELGWTPEDAIGKKMFLGSDRPGIVKGVVKDFNYESLHTPIGSLVLFPEPRANIMMVKLSGRNTPQAIAFLEQNWKQFAPHRPFEYNFLDDIYTKMYNSEIRLSKVLNLFAGIAVLLACLGLLGLSAYSTKQRTKEIGIRKVMGATVWNIVSILSKDFLRLSLIAILIAYPIAWWSMHQWLQDFSYRVSINWWIFLLAGLLAIAITLLTVSYQSVRAALRNPVKSLRTE